MLHLILSFSMLKDSQSKLVQAVPKIEEFWFMTDHDLLRAAACELLLNLLFFEEYYKSVVKVGFI